MKPANLLCPLLLALAVLPGATMAAGPQVMAEDAKRFTGKTATVCGKVESAKYAQNAEGEPTFLHLGAAFPRHPFQVRINGSDRGSFGFAPEEALAGELICATGRVVAKSGRAEMLIKSPSELARGVMKG